MMMTVRVGDVLPWCARPSLYTPGAPRWYALRCAPLREERAVAHLKEHGIAAFFPVVRIKTTVRGRPQERRQTFLPGYIFALFPGEPDWQRVIDREDPGRVITDVIRMASGTPGVIREDAMASIREMVRQEEAHLAAERRAREASSRPTPKPGEIVRIPAISGLQGEVVSIATKGGLRVMLPLFGAPREVTVESEVETVTA